MYLEIQVKCIGHQWGENHSREKVPKGRGDAVAAAIRRHSIVHDLGMKRRKAAE